MRTLIALALLCFAGGSATAQTAADAASEASQACANKAKGLQVERVVEIDPSSGPLFGSISRFGREASFLKPKEVVLTFDDGPLPWITKSILDTLDAYCTKATFFSVGQMALAYPNVVKDVIARGHTLGTHTWSHPLNLRRLPLEKAKDQIERGFAAVSMAAGKPIAPFFRFPGLSDSDPLLAHLQSLGVAAFTVDVVSNDSYIGSPDRLAKYALSQIEERQGGIILFHDIKAATAKALPVILAALKEKGYSVVQLRSKTTFTPKAELVAQLQPVLDKSEAALKSKALVPFYGAVIPGDAGLPVTELAPEPRPRQGGGESAENHGPRKARPQQDATDGEEPVEGKRRHRHKTEKNVIFPQFDN